MHPLLVEAILEDIFSDLLKKFPEKQQELTQAKEAGVKPKYLGWLAKILSQTQEPVGDIIPLLIAFDKKQPAISAKFGGKAADITSYKTAQELSDRIEGLEAQKAQKQGLTGDVDILYQDQTWLVALPRTTEESCQLGAGTTWCTARTGSQNMFLSYTARGENIFLFYVINKQGNPRSDPNSKLSIGLMDGEPKFDDGYGGVTVNAANHGISEEQFREIVGPENAAKFLALMKQKVANLGGKHPAQKEIDAIAQNAELTKKKLDSFKNEEERADFIRLILQSPSIAPGVLTLLSQEKEERIRMLVAKNPKTPPETLAKLDQAWGQGQIRWAVARNPSASPELLRRLSQDSNANTRDSVASNPSTPLDVLLSMSKSPDGNRRGIVAANRSLPPEVLTTLSRDRAEMVRWGVARNPSAPLELLRQLSQDVSSRVRSGIAENPKTPPEVLTALSQDDSEVVLSSIARNPKAPPEVLTALSQNNDGNVRQLAASNPSTPPEVLAKLGQNKYEHEDIRNAAQSNPNYPRNLNEGVQRPNFFTLL